MLITIQLTLYNKFYRLGIGSADFYFVVQLVTFEFSAVALNKQIVNFSCDFFPLLLIRKTVNVNCNISVSLSILSCPDYFHRSHLPFSAAAVRR